MAILCLLLHYYLSRTFPYLCKADITDTTVMSNPHQPSAAPPSTLHSQPAANSLIPTLTIPTPTTTSLVAPHPPLPSPPAPLSQLLPHPQTQPTPSQWAVNPLPKHLVNLSLPPRPLLPSPLQPHLPQTSPSPPLNHSRPPPNPSFSPFRPKRACRRWGRLK